MSNKFLNYFLSTLKTAREIGKKLLKILNPAPLIGGLEIGDLAIRYFGVSNGKIIKAAAALEPGTISGGKLKDRGKLAAALKSLRNQIAVPSKDSHVIVSLPAANIYTQTFNIPALADEKKIEEAVRLNLQAISPIDIKNAYYDAQKLRETPVDGGQIDFLAAFVNSQIVEEFASVVRESGFSPVAVEFPALSLARLIREKAGGLNFSQSHLVASISGDGLNFLILMQGLLYFQYFLPWQSVQEEFGGRQLNLENIKEVVLRELKRLVNFFASRFGGQPEIILFSSPAPLPEIAKSIQENFMIKVADLALAEFADLPQSFYAAAGAALRGLIRRSQDIFISLAAIGTEEDYFRSHLLSFINMWRNIAFVSLTFIFIALLVADSALARTTRVLNQELARIASLPNAAEISELRKQVEDFNRLTGLAAVIDQKHIDWNPFLSQLTKMAANSRVTYDRIFVAADRRAVVSARATSETAAIGFKNQFLKLEKNFQRVSMPLSGISVGPSGVLFSINFDAASFDF